MLCPRNHFFRHTVITASYLANSLKRLPREHAMVDSPNKTEQSEYIPAGYTHDLSNHNTLLFRMESDQLKTTGKKFHEPDGEESPFLLPEP